MCTSRRGALAVATTTVSLSACLAAAVAQAMNNPDDNCAATGPKEWLCCGDGLTIVEDDHGEPMCWAPTPPNPDPPGRGPVAPPHPTEPGAGGGGGGGGGGGDAECALCEDSYDDCMDSATEFSAWCSDVWALDWAERMCEQVGVHIDGTQVEHPTGWRMVCTRRTVVHGLRPEQNDIVESCRRSWDDPENCLRGWLRGKPGGSNTSTDFDTVTLPWRGGEARETVGSAESVTVSWSPETGLQKSCVQAGTHEAIECAGHKHACDNNHACR